MIRNLVLTAALMLTAEAVVPAVAPGLSITSTASAADFTGRVKRIRIKKKRVGSGFKIVVSTGSDAPESIGSAEITVSSLEGEVLGEITLDSPNRSRLVATTDIPIPEDDGVMEVTLTLTGETDDDVSTVTLKLTGEEPEAVDAESGFKVRIREHSDGARVVVLHENKDWDGSGVLDVTAKAEGYEAESLPIEEVRQRLAADWGPYIIEDDIMLRAVLFDEDGNTLDSVEQRMSPEGATEVVGLSQATLKTGRDDEAKLVSWTRSDGQAAALEVELVDSATGESVIEGIDDTPVRTQRGFGVSEVEFDGEESPNDYIYLCLIDLIDTNGDPVGEQYEVELTVPAMGEGGVVGSAYQVFADGDGLISFLQDADGIGIHVVLEGEEVDGADSVNVIFEEPYEGPAPLEIWVNATLRVQWDKWVQSGVSGVPDSYSLSTTLVTPEGEVLDEATATGGGTGSVYKSGDTKEDDEETDKDVLLDGIVKRRTKGGFVVDISGIEA
ncbi:MAG: hypothetical protein ACI8RZ_001404 [Myxococcota bacterium]|jgi:hypothetical protein